MIKDSGFQQVAEFWLGEESNQGRLRLFRIGMFLGVVVTAIYAASFALNGRSEVVPYILLPYFVPFFAAFALSFIRWNQRIPVITFIYLITINIATRILAEPSYLVDMITFSAFVSGCYGVLKPRVALYLTIYHFIGLFAMSLIVRYYSPMPVVYHNADGLFSFVVTALATAVIVWVMIHIQARNADRYFRGLQEKVLEVMQLNQDQRLLLGVVLHDFSNDLMRAMWISERLQTKEKEDDLPDRLSLALNSMADLIGQLKKLRHSSSLEAAGTEPVRIGDVIDRAQLGFRDLLKQNRIQLQVAGDLEIQVKVPMIILSASIINNLISNAIKYSCQGNIVKISIRKRDGFVGLTIVNIGPPTDEHSFRAALDGGSGVRAISHAQKGQNLGLLIAARFCERVGISILGEQIQSGEGIFTTTLQLQIPEWSHDV